MSYNLIQELDALFKSFSKSGLAEYMDLTLDATTKWRIRRKIPYNKLKRVVEYLENHNDDCITVCEHIMEEYKEIQQEKEQKLLLRKQRRGNKKLGDVKNVENK